MGKKNKFHQKQEQNIEKFEGETLNLTVLRIINHIYKDGNIQDSKTMYTNSFNNWIIVYLCTQFEEGDCRICGQDEVSFRISNIVFG